MCFWCEFVSLIAFGVVEVGFVLSVLVVLLALRLLLLLGVLHYLLSIGERLWVVL